MALIMKKLFQGYFWLFDEVSDPRANEYLFMRSPLWPILSMAIYIWFIFDYGPKFMKNRKPFNLDKVIIGFNIFQMVANAYIFLNLLRPVTKLNSTCSPIDYSVTPENMKILRMVYYYYLLKVIDLLDTVFFVLKKNDRQVTFLHVYHHFGMVGAIWIGVKFVPSGQSLYVPFINTFVHVMMYFHYLLTVYSPTYKQNVWLKKYITQLQLAQFAILSYLLIVPLLNPWCTYPKIILFLLIPQNILMVFLFGEFYVKNYLKK